MISGRVGTGILLGVLLVLGAIPDRLDAGELMGTSPNAFLRRGPPTFVVGTAGDDHADREIRAQVNLVRHLLFPEATVVVDDSIAVARGPQAWPPNPIVYGGSQTNSVLARLGPTLPFQLERGKLVLGGRVFAGDDYQLITVVPARQADQDGPGSPEFLLYAGTGSPGIAEINGLSHGPEPILIGDGFGRLIQGQWRLVEGQTRADFPLAPSRRIGWRVVRREIASAPGLASMPVRFSFPAILPAASDESRTIAACLRGLTTASQKLMIASPIERSVYVYPDRGSKIALTGDKGDGHAILAAQAFHVLPFDPAEEGPLERLVAHEGTHLLTSEAWGLPGSPLLGEGVAVWVAGQYGGLPLEQWKRRLA